MEHFLLSNCQIFTGSKWLQGHSIEVRASKVAALHAESRTPSDLPNIDLQGLRLCAGFWDLQIYGADGLLFSENMTQNALARIETAILKSGTTGFLLTIPSMPFEKIREAVAAVRTYWPQSLGALRGMHIEGPYLHPSKKGAHVEAWLKKPEPGEIQWFADNADVVKFITVAPEMVEDEDIRRLVSAGIVVSAGHTNTLYNRYKTAFAAGITHVTHLFNAQPAFEGRNPALFAALSESPAVRASIIADGQHVHFPAVRLAKRLFGRQMYFITDAVSATERLQLRNGAYFNEQNILTGSALTMPDILRNAVQELGISLEETLRMMSVYPAEVMAWQKSCGFVRRGQEASFSVFDEDFALKNLFLKGKSVHLSVF